MRRMHYFLSMLAVMALPLSLPSVQAAQNDCLATTNAPTLTERESTPCSSDLSGNQRTTLGTLLAGEDQANDVLKVEERFSYSRVAADASVKSGAGFLHTITCSTTAGAAATAGAITLYDNTAESGTSIQTIGVTATAFNPYTLVLDVSFSTGLYVGYDATAAGVNCTVSYR